METTAHLASVLHQFFQFDSLLRAEPFGSGNINDTYRVEFLLKHQPQIWILQRLNHQVFTNPDAVMHNIQIVAEHLHTRPDFPLQIPTPVPLPDGRLLHRDAAGNYWRVFPFYENTYAPEHLPDPAVAYEAARAYGIFLYALRDCPLHRIQETIPGFHDTDRRWAAFQEILKQNPVGRAQETQAEIMALLAAKPVFDAVSTLKKSGELPLRITHNDTKAGNVLLDNTTGRAVAVIDWDTIMPGTVLSDFGDMVRTFAADRQEDKPGTVAVRADILQALQQGFLEQTADFLTETERENLSLGAQWIVGEQALRFFTDYLAGDVYYKIKYPEHNLVRAQNQLALFRALS